MAEHSNRYGRFAVELCKNGYAVFICDLLGHGNSVSDDSELGYFGENGVESLVDDMKQLNDIARREYQGLPMYLFGHSMGSFLARAYTAKYPDTIDGTIWCGTSGANPAAGLGAALARAIESAAATIIVRTFSIRSPSENTTSAPKTKHNSTGFRRTRKRLKNT